MATVTQRLAFLISANADQAIKAFEKTSGSAAKEMAKAEKSLAKAGASLTKFGAAGLATAGTLGGGLFKLAQGAIEDQKAQALLAEQLRNSTGATQKQIDAIEDLIDKTARATGVADDQLRPAFGNLVRAFGDTDKATKVLNTALDISAATGRDLETVTIALGRAATGNVGALSRLGIPLDANVKKSKDFNAALRALNEQFGGAAAARAETYAGKLDRARVAISEAGESLGNAFIPVVEKSATALASAVNGIGQLNERTGGLIGKVATFGTVGLGAVSAMSLITGQAIKLRDRFGELDATTGKFNGKLTTLGKATVAGSGLIAGAATIYAIYNQKKQEAEQRTKAFADALALEGEEQRDALGALATSDNMVRVYIDSLKLLGLTTDDIAQETSGATTKFDELRSALDTFRARQGLGRVAAEQFADAIGYQGELTVNQVNQINKLVQEVDRLTDSTDKAAQAQKAVSQVLGESGANAADAQVDVGKLTQTYRDFSEAILSVEDRIKQARIDAAIEATRKQQEESDRKRSEAARKYKADVEALAQALEQKLSGALSNAEENAKNANEAYKNYRDSIAGSVSGVVNFSNAQATAEENAKTLADALTKQSEAQTKLNQALTDGDAEKIAEARRDLADATTEVANAEKLPRTFDQALKGQVQSATDFKTQLQTLLDLGADQALIDQLTAAGADAGGAIIKGILASADPKARVDELDATLASIGQLATTIGVSAADQFYGAGVKLANDLLSGVEETIGKIDVENIKTGKNPKRRLKQKTKQVDQSFATLFGLAGLAIPDMADGGIVKASPGGTLVRVAEAGRDEAILPLPSAMQSPSIINITVNAGMGADGTQVGKQIVDELVAYQRRVGALPIKVSG
jgi:hypothetical protein